MADNYDEEQKASFVTTVNSESAQNSKTVSDTDSQWKSISRVFLILDILLFVIVLTIGIIWCQHNYSCDRSLEGKLPPLCLPCNDLKLHPDDDVENFRDFTLRNYLNTTECCAETSKQIQRLIDLAVEEKFRKDKCRGFIGRQFPPYDDISGSEYKKPAAVVVGFGSNQNNDHNSTLIWDHGSTRSYIGPHITYSNGSFIVTQTGIYYIYSQVIFSDKDKQDSPILHHYIHRRSANMKAEEYVRLLDSSQSKCERMSPSYIGAVFHLQENDGVMVSVSHPHKLYLSESSSYFGMHMI